jgi:seryl-tRNA synthetase
MTTKPDYAGLIKRLRGLCIDWTGEPIVDGSLPRIETDCGTLRQAANAIASLQAERDEALAERDKLTSQLHHVINDNLTAEEEAEEARAALQSQLTEAREALRLMEPYRRAVARIFAFKPDASLALGASEQIAIAARKAAMDAQAEVAALSNLQPAGKDTE